MINEDLWKDLWVILLTGLLKRDEKRGYLMKRLLLVAVGLLAAGSLSVSAHKGERCAECRPHEHSCEPEPRCVEMVERNRKPCKSCKTDCAYECPTGTTRVDGKGEDAAA